MNVWPLLKGLYRVIEAIGIYKVMTIHIGNFKCVGYHHRRATSWQLVTIATPNKIFKQYSYTYILPKRV